MKNKKDLIYDLIFSQDNNFEINIPEYITDIYNYDDFIEEILDILRRSKVMVLEDELDLSNNKIIWSLKLKK